MKFLIDIPATYNKSVELDRINGNKYQQDATKNEMNNVEVTFKLIDNRKKLPIAFNKITFHLILHIKFDPTKKIR